MVDPFSSLAGLMTIIQMTMAAAEQAKSHQRNVQALARRIKLLIPLIQEVQEREMTEAQSDSFENLQIAIERARDLIVKCGERSKMYMMFRGTGIIEKFKDVSLDLDRCLNALPLVNLKVSEEIRQQVDSVSTQLRTTKYTIDEIDQKLSSDIALVLKEQREGLEANQALMRQLAEKLELNSHDRVLAEAQALEREKEEVRAEKDRQEEAYITQIINLLSVMETTQVQSDAGPSGSQESKESLPRSGLRLKTPPQAPEEFRCPISLELMADPVVIASGQTFDRACIQKWLAEGHRTCPITRTPLNNLELISNYSLKNLISDWCETNHLPPPIPPALSPPRSPSGRVMTEALDSFALKGEDVEEKWSRSGPMTVPDRGTDANFGKGKSIGNVDVGKGKGVGDTDFGKGKQIAEGSSHKVGLEHFYAAPATLVYEQHERMPSERGRMSLDDIISGDAPGPSSSSTPHAKPTSRRTFRAFQGGESSSRQGPPSEELMPQSFSSEFKPPRPPSGTVKTDPSQPGHRRNSSAPLDASGELAQLSGPKPAPRMIPKSDGSETEDLTGYNFAAPPPPRSLPKQDRPVSHASSLPSQLGPSGRDGGASPRHENDSHHGPKFAPPSPIRSEYPVAVTPSGHAVRHNSYIPPKVLAEMREPQLDPKKPVTAAELQSMKRDLRSNAPERVRSATGDLRLLAKYSMENRAAIASAGIIRELIDLLLSTDPKVQENAVTALLNLSIHDDNKALIAREGAISKLVEVLQGGQQEAKENAAATLFSLSVLEECKLAIGAQAGAIVGLVDLLRTGSALGKKDATTALFNLSICHENKNRIVRNGAVGPLIQLIKDPSLQEKVVAVLANLTTIGEGRLAITEAWGIKALVAVTERGSPRAKENAAAALLQLCINSSRHTAYVYQEGVVPSLMSLQQTGTSRAKEKAKALLRHFRDNLQDTVQP